MEILSSRDNRARQQIQYEVLDRLVRFVRAGVDSQSYRTPGAELGVVTLRNQILQSGMRVSASIEKMPASRKLTAKARGRSSPGRRDAKI